MNILKEPPPQTTSPTREGNDWLYRWSQAVSSFISSISTGSGGGSHLTGVTSVTSPDVALSVAPTTGAVVASTNDFVGDAGSGGLHGVVPAPAAGDTAAGKFLSADGGWEVPSGGGSVTEVDTSAPITGGPITTTGTIAVSTMTGDSGSGGARGVVPAPAAGDTAAGKFLKADATWAVPPGTGSGTVTSVALTVPAEFSVSGSPVTTSGTLAVTKANESANTVWAGPTTGAAAAPTFRALVSADLPGGTGTVSSIATSPPITGGTITTTGTIGVTDFVASGASHARGTVPDPGASAGSTKFLREDATWAIPSGTGAISFINSATGAGVSSLDVLSFVSGSYINYLITVDGVFSSSAGTALNILFSTDGGLTWLSTNYQYAFNSVNRSGANTAVGGTNAAAIVPTTVLSGNTDTFYLNGHGILFNPSDTAAGKAMTWTQFAVNHTTGNFTSVTGAGGNNTTLAVDSIRFITGAGTITGTLKVYGIV